MAPTVQADLQEQEQYAEDGQGQDSLQQLATSGAAYGTDEEEADHRERQKTGQEKQEIGDHSIGRSRDRSPSWPVYPMRT